jgi:hypothetical protein
MPRITWTPTACHSGLDTGWGRLGPTPTCRPRIGWRPRARAGAIVAGGRQPQPVAGGRQPQPVAGGRQPQPVAGGRQPQPVATGQRRDMTADAARGRPAEYDPRPMLA